MDSEDLSPSRTAFVDKPSGDAPEENWMEMIKELKAVNKDLEEKLAAATESGVEEYQDKLTDLEKERDNWKKMAEEEKEKNAVMVEEKKALLNEKAVLIKKEKFAAQRQEALKKLLKHFEIENKGIKNGMDKQIKMIADLRNQLSDKIMINMPAEWKNKVDEKEGVIKNLLECFQKQFGANREKQVQLEEELAELKRQEALADCKICFERPVQNVFPCGHTACDKCYDRLTAGLESEITAECHICPERIEQKAQKIYFT